MLWSGPGSLKADQSRQQEGEGRRKKSSKTSKGSKQESKGSRKKSSKTSKGCKQKSKGSRKKKQQNRQRQQQKKRQNRQKQHERLPQPQGLEKPPYEKLDAKQLITRCNLTAFRLGRMLSNLKFVLITAITLSCLYPCDAPADPNQSANLEILWERVLSDPKHIQNNIDYGTKAKNLGHYQRAISAYRRVLKIAPNNAEALSNIEVLRTLTRPAETSGTLITTASYNANSGQSRRNARGDTALAKTLLIADDREFLGTRWNSSVVNFADAHSFLRNSDVIFSSLKSGPTAHFSQTNRKPRGGFLIILILISEPIILHWVSLAIT